MRIRARYAVVPLALALALTGCGRPGTAAMLDGQRITDAQVATLTADLVKLQGTGTSQSALSSLVNARVLLELGEENGIAATTQEGRQLLDDVAANASKEPWDYSPELLEVAQFSVVANTISSDPDLYDEAIARLDNLDITLNPRFGTWEGSQGVTAPTWPWVISSGDDVADAAATG